MKKVGSAGGQKKKRITVIRPRDRIKDSEHGFIRGWGVLGRLTGSKNISMAYGKLRPGVKATAHQHPYETAIYIIAGSVRVYYGTKRKVFEDVKAGDFIYIPPFVPHEPQNLGGVPMEYIVARDCAEEIGETVK